MRQILSAYAHSPSSIFLLLAAHHLLCMLCNSLSKKHNLYSPAMLTYILASTLSVIGEAYKQKLRQKATAQLYALYWCIITVMPCSHLWLIINQAD